ncbi:MAG: hypothetical protein GXY52_11105 [Chloroflexi bacterium]|nr:hypothetical protein [Chloroflexota bacterium]
MILHAPRLTLRPRTAEDAVRLAQPGSGPLLAELLSRRIRSRVQLAHECKWYTREDQP